MELTSNDLLLVTGATGLVGSHVVERACRQGIPTRAICRSTADTSLLEQFGAEIVHGDLTDADSLRRAAEGATLIVHCAAKVGDWGPTEDYRTVNVRGLETLLEAAEKSGTLRKIVHISSLGVYPAQDHYGTDETTEPSTRGIDGYTLTKVEAENLIRQRMEQAGFPAVILRPGFIYGPRDRTVIPRILERLRDGQFKYLGSPEKLMNNTCVFNLVDAVFLGLENDQATGRIYNITDGRLVSKREFISTIAEEAGCTPPTGVVPLGVARGLAWTLESVWKMLGKQEAPILSGARIKFLGLNLEYSIDRARQELGYAPAVDFQQGMKQTIAWFTEQEAPASQRKSAAA